MKALHKIHLLFIIGILTIIQPQKIMAQHSTHTTEKIQANPKIASLKNKKETKLSALPQRDRKVAPTKVAPPKSSRPDRELKRPRETAPKIKEPKISKADKEVKEPKKIITAPQPPRKPS